MGKPISVLRTLLVTTFVLGSLAGPAVAHDVNFNGVDLSAREISPDPATGKQRVEIKFQIRCTNQNHIVGTIAVWRDSESQPLYFESNYSNSAELPAEGTAIASPPDPVPAGSYKPSFAGACYSDEDMPDGHVGDHGPVGPPELVVYGPVFQIGGCAARTATASRALPMIPVAQTDPCKPAASKDECKNGGSAAKCAPDCKGSAGAARFAPVIPVSTSEKCAPETVTKKNEVPVPISCADSTGAARSARVAPVIPVRDQCKGLITMVSMERVACKLHFTLKISLRSPVIPVKPCPKQSAQAGAHASAGRDMVVHRRVWLGQAKFSVQAGQVRIANVKLGERASFVRQRRHLKVLAVIAYKTDRGVVKTRRTFTVVSA